MQLREIADHYALDDESALKTFAELQALGFVNLIGNSSAIIHSPNPKEMQEAYQVRAALEEIAGRTAAAALKGKTTVLENDARPTQRSRTAAPLQIIWSYCTDAYGSLIDRSIRRNPHRSHRSRAI